MSGEKSESHWAWRFTSWAGFLRAAGHMAALQCLISLWQLWFSGTERQVKYWWPCSGFSTCYLLGGSAVSLCMESKLYVILK